MASMSSPVSEKLVAAEKTAPAVQNLTARIGLFLGPALAVAILWMGPPDGVFSGEARWSGAWITLALLALMAAWWVTEALPIPVTSLLPLVVLPLAGVQTMAETASPYMHPIVVLLLGGFLFAKAIERWGLHERIALNVLVKAGEKPSALIAGFMLAAALLSMWISNTATAIMMTPIALSVAAGIEGSGDSGARPFTFALLLGIAYACSVGGLGTPIGTPTNLIVLGYLNEHGGYDIGFAQWLSFGLPVVLVMIPLIWFILTRVAFKMPRSAGAETRTLVREKLAALGPTTSPEWRTMFVFTVIAGMWMFRRPLNDLVLIVGETEFTPLSGLSDHVTAIIAVFLCFLIPAGGKNRKGQQLLDWRTAEQIPWGVLLLFGGGMSLAGAISGSGLSTYLGQCLAGFMDLPLPVVILIVTGGVLALTEVTSNIATASALMPILGAVAMGGGAPLELLAAPVALAASCAFMMPMATGPNAVVFATGRVPLATMAKAGFVANLIAVLIITAASYVLAPLTLG